MSAVTTNTTTPPIRGGPFTINLLNTILAFAAADERDVYLCYTLVCKQWREAELFYCREMWKNLAIKLFSGNLPRSNAYQWSHWSYMKRRRATTKFTKDIVLSGELDEIENCGLLQQQEQQQQEDDSSNSKEATFGFRCPLLSRNLRILENEVVPGNLNRNVLFCDVCEKRVYPISDAAQAKNLPKNESGNACVVIRKTSTYDQVNKFLANPDDKQNKNELRTWYNDQGPFNVALVTTEAAPPLDGIYTVHGTAPSGRFGLAEQILAKIAEEHTRVVSERIDITTSAKKKNEPDALLDGDDDDGAEQEQPELVEKKEKINVNAAILSKELLVCSMFSYPAVHVRIVRIPPPPADLNAETVKTKYSSMHPALPDNALGKNKMPTKNGWNLMFAVDEDVNKWFKKDIFPEGARALLGVFYLSYLHKPHLESLSRKANANKNSEETAAQRRQREDLEEEIMDSLFQQQNESILMTEESAKTIERQATEIAQIGRENTKQKGLPLNSYLTEEEKKEAAKTQNRPELEKAFGLKEKIEETKAALLRKNRVHDIIDKITDALYRFAEVEEEMGEICEPSWEPDDSNAIIDIGDDDDLLPPE